MNTPSKETKYFHQKYLLSLQSHEECIFRKNVVLHVATTPDCIAAVKTLQTVDTNTDLKTLDPCSYCDYYTAQYFQKQESSTEYFTNHEVHVDSLVAVRNSIDAPFRIRHYKGLDKTNGFIETFNEGTTSFSWYKHISPYAKCQKWKYGFLLNPLQILHPKQLHSICNSSYYVSTIIQYNLMKNICDFISEIVGEECGSCVSCLNHYVQWERQTVERFTQLTEKSPVNTLIVGTDGKYYHLAEYIDSDYAYVFKDGKTSYTTESSNVEKIKVDKVEGILYNIYEPMTGGTIKNII